LLWLRGQLDSDDFAAIGIDAEVQFTPGSASGRAMLFDKLFAGPIELHAGAVHEKIYWACSRRVEWRQRLAAAAVFASKH